MAGLADLFGMGDGSGMFGGGAGMYADLLTPEMKQQMAFRGLMAAAGALGQAAMPSRMPVPIGAALGSAAGAMADAQDKGLESALKALLTGGKLQEMKAKIDMQRQLMDDKPPDIAGLFGPTTPSGAPQPLVPSAVAPGAYTLGSSSVGGTGGWGPLAAPAVETLSGSGLSPAAVQGIMANGLGEGGFNDPWKKAGGGENSFGHWQFNQGGELPGYLAWARGKGDPKDTKLQAQYVAQRMEELHPGFSQIDDPKAATDLVALKFERYQGAKPGQRYGYLADVQKAMSGGVVEPRRPIPATPGQLTDEGVALPAVPDFSGMVAGNQGPGNAPATTLHAQDAVVASGAPVVPRGGRIGAIGEGANARLVNMDTGEPISSPMPPAAQSTTAQVPAAFAQGGVIDPRLLAYAQWAQRQARGGSALGIQTPGYIGEAASLPFKYFEPGANPTLQGQIAGSREAAVLPYVEPKAAAEAKGKQPYLLEQERLKAELALRSALAQQGRALTPEGTVAPIPNFNETAAATTTAVESAKPTDTQRDYNAYVKDQQARGGPVLSFGEWDSGRRRAGATMINTAEGLEAAQTKARIAIDTKAAQEIGEQALVSRRLMPVVDEITRLADKTPEGYAGPLAASAAKTFSALGLPVSTGMSNAEAMLALSQRLVPLVREPGATSQKELDIYLRSVPGLMQSEDGRKKIAEVTKTIMLRSIDIAKVYRENVGAPDLFEKLSALDKPILTDAQRVEIERAAGTPVPAPNPSGVITTPYGIIREVK